MPLVKDGMYFKDELGRVRLLRGVNLGGSSKVPKTPDGASHLREGFFEHHEISFVGRPFPLEDADEHFLRLKAWGLDFLRFVVTWEAVEHEGAGQYDIAYLDYLEALVEKAAAYEINLFIDFHQDVWSRFSGGDGAPAWTLDAVGFELKNFAASGAALIHQLYGDPFPKMHWATNYQKLAAGTMFTLFFAGTDFAPETKIEGLSVQEFLQSHYCAMMEQVARRLANKSNVIGYDCMNEPSKGYIGYKNVNRMEWDLKLAYSPTPYQAMLLGDGRAQFVDFYSLTYFGPVPRGKRRFDPKGVRAWQDGVDCIWKRNGLWDTDSKGRAVLLRPDFFNIVGGDEVLFTRDYLRPFINRASRSIHAADPDAMIFVEFDAIGADEIPHWTDTDAKNIVYAPHWYDFLTLMTKQYYRHLGVDALNYRVVAGHEAKRISFIEDLAFDKMIAETRFRGVPTLIGEVGIPYDMNNRAGYFSDNWDTHVLALDDTMAALDANLLNFTLWNYTADNTNKHGDSWNGEDLSIYSPDQRSKPDDINSGGRALLGFVRPYARATAGQPIQMQFDLQKGEFFYRFCHEISASAPSEFYIPNLQYPNGYEVEVSDGRYESDTEEQRLYYWHDTESQEHWLRISPKTERHFSLPIMKRDFLTMVTMVLAFFLAYLYVDKNTTGRNERV
jgi:aryl-phospho-beta-D-glucosidase BglC (GH1 family)